MRARKRSHSAILDRVLTLGNDNPAAISGNSGA
jgi:hypothetical protein